MQRTVMTWITLFFLLVFALPAFADEASSDVSATGAEAEPRPADPAADPEGAPKTLPDPAVEPEDSPQELPDELFVPDPVYVLYCEEDCPDGSTISCSCPGTGSCTSGGGGSGPVWIECLCNGATDDEDQCPFTPPPCTPQRSTCKSGISCTCDGNCGSGTCWNGTCNCDI